MAKDPYHYFRIEARELLDGLAQGVLALEKGDTGRGLLDRLLRFAHTLKGAARVVKQGEVAELAHAMEGLELPPEVALQKGKPFYRAGDHELMSSVLAGEVHNPPAGGSKQDLFTIRSIVPGPVAAGPVADTGCKIAWPA